MVLRSVFVMLLLITLNIKADTINYVTSIDAFRLTTNNVFSVLTGTYVTPLDRPISVSSRGGLIYFFDAGLNGLYQYDQASQKAFPMNISYRNVVTRDVKVYLSVFQELYVLDPAGGQVLQFNVLGNLIQRYTDILNLNAPQAMCINPANLHVFIADKYYSHVVEFGVGGIPVALHGLRGSGQESAGGHIVDMACGQNSFYVLSSLDKMVKHFSYSGRYIEGILLNPARQPVAITMDKSNRLYIADDYDDTIKMYRDGQYFTSFGGTDSGLDGFREIKDLWFDEPYLYVADSANRRIQVYEVEPLHEAEASQ